MTGYIIKKASSVLYVEYNTWLNCDCDLLFNLCILGDGVSVVSRADIKPVIFLL